MSVNRENIAWQREDGTWCIGFWSFYNVGQDEEDWDFEWGVEYEHDSFWYFSEGHSSAEAALEAFCRRNANPGQSNTMPWHKDAADEIAKYEAIAVKFKQEKRKVGRGIRSTWKRL